MSVFSMMLALFATSFALPMPDYLVTESAVVVPLYSKTGCMETNINCTQCVNFMNVVKNDTQVLINVTKDIENICSKIYGPTAHECVNVTHSIEKGLNYIVEHNSSSICKHLHYC